MGEADRFAEIIVNKAVERVDRIFHYRIPERLQKRVQVGSVVLLPFGRQEIEGVVVGFIDSPEVSSVRDIKDVISDVPLFHKELIDLAAWIADYYMCPKASALQAMLPAGLKMSGENVRKKSVDCVFLSPGAGPERGLVPDSAPKQKAVLSFLELHEGAAASEVLKAAGAARSSLKALEKKGIIKIISCEVYRDPYNGETFSVSRPGELTVEQKKALEEILSEDRGLGRPVLLHGVTGSGKTEVYLKLVEKMTAGGRQSIILVPEIALTPQMVAVFKTRLGEKVAVLHSGLSAGERRDAWMHIASGRIRVVVGARSAVFAPCRDLGLIVIDEEHEQSYKQDNAPRFHAREVALKRARLQGAVLLMGSATPSVETYYKAQKGAYRLVVMGKRVLDRPMPSVIIEDMREELKNGNRSIFSGTLKQKMAERLDRGEQTLLFLNRRGFHTFVSCRACGHVLICPHCAISLTYHASGSRLKCHYCGFSRDIPGICPECGSKAIRHFGTGTQRVEDEVKRLFPQARVARVDTDTMTLKGSYDRVYRQVRKGEIDFLVGTQMIAKGLDFPGVTLVGVISADISLHLPELRAAERTFQLITQVAGRSGRGSSPGEVVIQTYNPEDAAILAAASQDYQAFFCEEIKKRKAACYPPYGFLIRVLFISLRLSELTKYIDICARFIKEEMGPDDFLLGPAPAPLERIKDRFRMQLVLKGKQLTDLRTALHEGLKKAGQEGIVCRDVNVSIDIEPINMM